MNKKKIALLAGLGLTAVLIAGGTVIAAAQTDEGHVRKAGGPLSTVLMVEAVEDAVATGQALIVQAVVEADVEKAVELVEAVTP